MNMFDINSENFNQTEATNDSDEMEVSYESYELELKLLWKEISKDFNNEHYIINSEKVK